MKMKRQSESVFWVLLMLVGVMIVYPILIFRTIPGGCDAIFEVVVEDINGGGGGRVH